MNFLELQVTLSFCLILFLRMLGMFMVLPVLSTYGSIVLDGGDKFLIGLAIGIYGFSQVLCQIPFGILSDKFGRKKIIIIGLLIFFVGNIIPANIHSIWGLIIGRFLQGAGAISGVCMALLSDLISEDNQIKSIAAIGVSFAISFLISMISGPLIIQYFGFFSIFWISGGLSIICIIITVFFIPVLKNDECIKKYICSSYNILLKLFLNKLFFRSYMGVFFLHFILMINFMIIPHQLEILGYFINDHWKIYLYTILLAFCVLFLFIYYCKNKYFLNNIIEISISFIFISSLILFLMNNYYLWLLISLQIFFIFFNFLEVFLPSHLSKNVSKSYKGSVMSIYSTSQFLGIGCGGVVSGWIYSFLTISEICLFQAIIILIWFCISFFLKSSFL